MAGRLGSKQARPGAQGWLPLTKAGRKGRTVKVPPPPIRETALHGAVAELLDWILVPPAVFTTFPAGWGKMTPAMAGMLHRCGLKRGMPDILVFHARRCLGIELKVPGRSQSAAQRAMTAKLTGAGIDVFVARSVDDVATILEREGIPLRGSLS